MVNRVTPSFSEPVVLSITGPVQLPRWDTRTKSHGKNDQPQTKLQLEP
jgi:hypothetical protein